MGIEHPSFGHGVDELEALLAPYDRLTWTYLAALELGLEEYTTLGADAARDEAASRMPPVEAVLARLNAATVAERAATYHGRPVARLESLRTVLSLAPILVTWTGLAVFFLSSASRSAESPWLGAVAILDVLLLVGVLVVSIRVGRATTRADHTVDRVRELFEPRLASVVAGIQAAHGERAHRLYGEMLKHPYTSIDEAARTLQDTSKAQVELIASLAGERERLTSLVEAREKAFGDLLALTTELKGGSDALGEHARSLAESARSASDSAAAAASDARAAAASLGLATTALAAAIEGFKVSARDQAADIARSVREVSVGLEASGRALRETLDGVERRAMEAALSGTEAVFDEVRVTLEGFLRAPSIAHLERLDEQLGALHGAVAGLQASVNDMQDEARRFVALFEGLTDSVDGHVSTVVARDIEEMATIGDPDA